ncbi:hypothetical protein DFH29DRAFT_897251, partial [Suillus ampliporus]
TTGSIETILCDYETIESVNEELYNALSELVKFYRECPFWQENGFCMNRECVTTTVEESEIPEKWRAATLSKPPLEERVLLPGCYYRDSDFCFLDDMTEGEYIDLFLVPEGYTGYSGPSVHPVWKSVYEENRFGLSEPNLPTTRSPAQVTLLYPLHYKVISGLHASVLTHICMQYLNKTTGEMGPNLECFVTCPPIYLFNTVPLLRAVSRIGPYLRDYDHCLMSTPTPHDHMHAQDVQEEARTLVLKEEFKLHFWDVSRIMDCVGCDKCSLWGKVKTTELPTALKIIFEMNRP